MPRRKVKAPALPVDYSNDLSDKTTMISNYDSFNEGYGPCKWICALITATAKEKGWYEELVAHVQQKERDLAERLRNIR